MLVVVLALLLVVVRPLLVAVLLLLVERKLVAVLLVADLLVVRLLVPGPLVLVFGGPLASATVTRGWRLDFVILLNCLVILSFFVISLFGGLGGMNFCMNFQRFQVWPPFMNCQYEVCL